MVKEANTYPIYVQNNIDTVKKQRNHKHPNKQLIPPKTIKLTQLTQ